MAVLVKLAVLGVSLTKIVLDREFSAPPSVIASQIASLLHIDIIHDLLCPSVSRQATTGSTANTRRLVSNEG